MRTVAIYVNTERAHAAASAERVVALARKHGITVGLCDGAGSELGFAESCAIEEADLLITVGGDGTLLRAARLVHELGIPILGVNTGRLGFLTEVESNDEGFAALEEVLRGELRVDERVALHAQVVGSPDIHFALNEVVVRRVTQARLAPFGLALDGETIAHLPSDGVIVATPTRSPAYFFGDGGA